MLWHLVLIVIFICGISVLFININEPLDMTSPSVALVNLILLSSWTSDSELLIARSVEIPRVTDKMLQ